jgi:ABC-type amino acid transport substrate-binding protein
MTVELWARVAQREALPYVLVPMPSISAMLKATRTGQIDVAVECINIAPKTLKQYAFSLPFQEDGQAVLVANQPLSLGKAFITALFSPTLLRLVGLLLVALILMSAAVWWFEDQFTQVLQSGKSPYQQFIMIFTVLFIGDGASEMVTTSGGRAVLIAAHIVRDVSSAVLVGFLTVELLQDVQSHASRKLSSVNQIPNLRIAYKPGTVSEELLRELGVISSQRSTAGNGAVPVQSIRGALQLLRTRQVDGVLADEMQLRYLKAQGLASDGLIPTVAISGIRPELQGFALSPQLPASVVQRINLSISQLKRNGVVQQLRERAITAAVVKVDPS